MKAIKTYINPNKDKSFGVGVQFEQSSLKDNIWYPTLNEIGSILRRIYESEDEKYKSKGGIGGEFTLSYLLERARGSEHEEISEAFYFKN